MRILVIDENSKAELARIRKYAEENVYTMDDLLDMQNGQKLVPGDMDEHTCIVPIGYRVVFSHEIQQGKNIRHVSMSLVNSKNVPHSEAVNMILPFLGFKNKMKDCRITVVEYGHLTVIDLMEIF